MVVPGCQTGIILFIHKHLGFVDVKKVGDFCQIPAQTGTHWYLQPIFYEVTHTQIHV